jgi:hypothetical protein
MLHHERLYVRDRRALGRLGVFEQCAGGGHRDRVIGRAERAQVERLELPAQRAARAVGIELPRREFPGRSVSVQFRPLRILAHQHFRRAQSLELVREVRRQRLHDREAARREREPRQAERRAIAMQREQQVVALLLEQRGIGQRARRHDAHHFALDRAFRRRRVADLLADGDRLAELHEPGEILLDGVIRHARHPDRLAPRRAPARERDVEQARRFLGVVEEKLVEVAHAVEKQHVRMLRLDPEVLLHHGCVGRNLGRLRVLAGLPLVAITSAAIISYMKPAKRAYDLACNAPSNSETRACSALSER